MCTCAGWGSRGWCWEDCEPELRSSGKVLTKDLKKVRGLSDRATLLENAAIHAFIQQACTEPPGCQGWGTQMWAESHVLCLHKAYCSGEEKQMIT